MTINIQDFMKTATPEQMMLSHINSDVKGSYNILVKTPTEPKTKFDNVFPKFNVYDIIEGVVTCAQSRSSAV